MSESYILDRFKDYVSSDGNSSLCGIPSFCKYKAVELCHNMTLMDCPHCSTTSAYIFVTAISVLGLLIITANSFLVWCIASKPSKFPGAYNRIKISLAIADATTGIEILSVVVSNFSWTVKQTPEQLSATQLALRGSPQAIAGGIFFNFTYAASLYHLVYLAQQRLFAIKNPLKYKMQSMRSVNFGLVLVWVLSILLASVAAWIPNVYTFTYSHMVYLFNVTLAKMDANLQITPLLLFVGGIYIIPFCVLSALLLVTFVQVRRVQTGFVGQTVDSGLRVRNSRREIRILKTLAIMQLGFTITLLPIIVVVILNYLGKISCEDLATPFTLCFYLSMTNSMVNVMVYSCRDEKFRNEVYEFLSKLSPTFCFKSRGDECGLKTTVNDAIPSAQKHF